MCDTEAFKAIALRLSRLGWTQDEIGGVIEVEQRHAGRILDNLAELPKSLKTLLQSGLGHDEVAILDGFLNDARFRAAESN